MRTKKCESHEDHDVCNQIEVKDDYVHLEFEDMTHKIVDSRRKLKSKRNKKFSLLIR